jgi:hypothetical protein
VSSSNRRNPLKKLVELRAANRQLIVAVAIVGVFGIGSVAVITSNVFTVAHSIPLPGFSPIFARNFGNSHVASPKAKVLANNLTCPVLSPLDLSCGFVVQPAAWAKSFPYYDKPIQYFHNGTYGIVWINSTSYQIIQPYYTPSGSIVPALCEVHLPSGTHITFNDTAVLPNHETIQLNPNYYSQCEANNLKGDFTDNAVFTGTTDPVFSSYVYYYVPGAPSAGSSAYVYFQSFSAQASGPYWYFERLAWAPVCNSQGVNCVIEWGMWAGELGLTVDGYQYVWDTNCPGYQGDCQQSPGVNDQMENDMSMGPLSGPPYTVCPEIQDLYPNYMDSYLCIQSDEGLSGIALQFSGADGNCAYYPSEPNVPTTFYPVEAYNANGVAYNLTWNTDSPSEGSCGDYQTTTSGTVASVTFNYWPS